jgi:hypothetical protein
VIHPRAVPVGPGVSYSWYQPKFHRVLRNCSQGVGVSVAFANIHHHPVLQFVGHARWPEARCQPATNPRAGCCRAGSSGCCKEVLRGARTGVGGQPGHQAAAGCWVSRSSSSLCGMPAGAAAGAAAVMIATAVLQVFVLAVLYATIHLCRYRLQYHRHHRAHHDLCSLHHPASTRCASTRASTTAATLPGALCTSQGRAAQ